MANILNVEVGNLGDLTAPVDRSACRRALEELVAAALAHRDDLRAGELTVARDVQHRKEIQATYAPRVPLQFSLFAREDESSGVGTALPREITHGPELGGVIRSAIQDFHREAEACILRLGRSGSGKALSGSEVPETSLKRAK